MNEISLKINKEEAAKIAECIKNIAGGISAGEIEEIVLRSPNKDVEVEPAKDNQPTISSKEIAEIFHNGHSVIFKKISKYICGYASEEEKKEFRLASFKIPQGQNYPMYELTQRGCELFLQNVQTWKNYKSIAMGVDKMRRVMATRFGTAPKKAAGQNKNFLLEGKPREEYDTLCRMFNDFITGPGLEGREISELTQKYEQFYKVMKQAQTNTKDNQEIEQAVFDVAIEAEMQGFIYGFKLFDAMLSKSLVAA